MLLISVAKLGLFFKFNFLFFDIFFSVHELVSQELPSFVWLDIPFPNIILNLFIRIFLPNIPENRL